MSILLERRPTVTAPRPSKLRKVWADDELHALPDDGNKYELVDGELVSMPPAFPEHGDCASSLSDRLGPFVRRRALGKCYPSQTGFRMKYGNLRSPDFSFVSSERLNKLNLEPKKFYPGAPDLCVEVLSDERPIQIEKKLKDYFESGARLVWWLDPATKTVRVYRDASSFELLRMGSTLDGEDVVPGFKLSLKKLFGG